MKDVLADLPGYSLRRASSTMLAEFSAMLAPLGLRPTDASMLVLIEANPGITSSAVGQMLAIQRANMVPLMVRLEEKRLISRTALDGRSIGLSLTSLGEECCTKVQAVIAEHEQNLLSRIPEAHRDHLAPALKALWST